MQLTYEQECAIMHDKGDVLVSASAGSGKTFVMIQRLIRLILEGKTGVSEILAVTFTSLAASEMKEKLVKAITDKINEPGISAETSARLKEQLSEMPTASISTFHSFCNDLVKNYFYELGLDASFKIADEVQADLLKAEAIDKLFEDLYAVNDNRLESLLALFVRRRSDRYLKDIIRSLHNFFVTEAYPEKAAESVVSNYTVEGYYRIKNAFFKHYRYIFEKICDDLEAVKEDLNSISAVKQIEACGNLISYARALISSKDLFEMSAIAGYVELNLPPLRGKDDFVVRVRERLSTVKKRLVTEAKYLHETFGKKTEQQCMEDLIGNNRTAKILTELCFEFDVVYSSLKREANVVDFADLEHFALQLLDKDDIRGAVSSRYEYVFADEYQDTNGVQEEILTRIGSNNVFMVGDIKQSIYAFRGCNPHIFGNKFSLFSGGAGTALQLTSNFRCSSEVLRGVNGVFSEIMTEETAETDYASAVMTGGNGEVGEAKLFSVIPGGEEETMRSAAKKGVYSVKENLNGNREDEVFTEGVLISDIIRKTLANPVTDADGEERILGYKDIVILTRSMGAYAAKLSDTLADNDIPVTSSVKKEITVYPEIRNLLSLLRVIDCARQDIPLCAVMRGPIGNFTDAELAEIRAFALKNTNGVKPRTFYDAVELYRTQAEGALNEKLQKFIRYIDKLRFLSDYEWASGILARVVRECDIPLYYLSRPDGKNRLKRINKLISESAGGEKPYTVREFLARIDAETDDISVSDAGGENAVRIMSIHASKGLEFPVVIIAGLNKQFNFADVRDEIVKDREFGFALKTYDLNTMRVSTNIFCEFIKKRYRAACVREEMRILYVAMTRAKSRLYLTQTAKNVPEEITPSDVFAANSYSKLISYKHMDFVQLTEGEVLSRCVVKQPRSIIAGKPDEELKEVIKQNLTFNYPFDTTVAAKSSVTAVLKSLNDTAQEFVPALFKDEPSSATVGDAYHRFMELADFEKPLISDIIEQKNKFVESGELSAEWSELIDCSKIRAVLTNDFFRLPYAEYYRELPFEALVPAKMIGNSESEEEVLIQGVIDIIAFTPEGLRLADYKVSGRSPDGLREHYRKQLELYAYAAEKITGLKVISKTLFNLKTGECVEL